MSYYKMVKEMDHAQCRMCDIWLSKSLYEQSIKEFNVPLCWEHQKVVKGLEKEEERDLIYNER